MIELIAYIVLNAFLALILMWFFLFEYRNYRVRVLRKHLFDVRDSLFAAANGGSLSFDDRAYGMARLVINGLIRKADALSIAYVLTLDAICDRAHREERMDNYEDRFTKAMDKLTDEGRAAAMSALADAHFHVVSHILHISIIFAVPMQVYKLGNYIGHKLGILRNGFSSVVQKVEHRVQDRLRDLDRQAFAESVACDNQALAAAA